MHSPLKILFVDDHVGLRDGMMYMLKTKNPMLEITGASDTAEAVGILKSGTEIGIVILDMNLDGENSLNAVPKLREAKPDVKILVYTMYNDEFHIKQALLAEVQGFVTKETPIEELEKAVVAVAEGNSYFGSAAEKVRQTLFPGKQNYNAADEKSYLFECYDSLGKKEREIFILLAQRLEVSEIAQKLGKSEKTILNQRTAVYTKLGIKDRLELFEKAKLLGLTF